MNPISLLLGLFAGAVFALQVVVNSQARLRLAVEGESLHPLQAALVNFAGGTILLALVCVAFRFPWPTAVIARQAPWWIWTGGVLGIIYVSSSVLLGPRLGVTLFLTLVVAGQMTGSLLLDHFGLLGAAIKPINWGRFLGVALVLAGVIVVAFSTSTTSPSNTTTIRANT